MKKNPKETKKTQKNNPGATALILLIISTVTMMLMFRFLISVDVTCIYISSTIIIYIYNFII